MIFHENPFTSYQVVTCTQTGRQVGREKPTGVCLQLLIASVEK
jgi:hypothetical protein